MIKPIILDDDDLVTAVTHQILIAVRQATRTGVTLIQTVDENSAHQIEMTRN